MEYLDLTGKKYGKLTAMYRIEDHKSKNGNMRTKWHCRCDCGNETDVIALNLTRNHTTSCGCARADGRKKLQRDVTGERFGHLVGIRKVENEGGNTKWLFRCDLRHLFKLGSNEPQLAKLYYDRRGYLFDISSHQKAV